MKRSASFWQPAPDIAQLAENGALWNSFHEASAHFTLRKAAMLHRHKISQYERRDSVSRKLSPKWLILKKIKYLFYKT
jgi:hypothetical protein